MNTLDYQFKELLDSSESQHGFWLKNHREAIEEMLKSGIATFGLRKMIEKLDDWQSPYVTSLYKKIKSSNN